MSTVNDNEQPNVDEKAERILDEEFKKILKDLNSTKITTNLNAIRTIKLTGSEKLIEDLPTEVANKLVDFYQNSASIIVREEAKEALIQFNVSLPESLFNIEESLSDRELLLRTIAILEKQDEELTELKSKVGSIYQFVIVVVILIVLANVIGFIGAVL